MPKPERFVSRSALGWGASGASYADPKKGLVIHYDGSDQKLASRDHEACVRYWKSTRDFHTGPSRGWADIGYCVDEETEILTAAGWKTFREVRPGDVALTLDHGTGLAEWQPVLDVYVFPARPRTMIRMAGRSHSSLTTPQHRWPVERPSRNGPGRERAWATTETLAHGDRIPQAAPCADLPTAPKWSDALVELVAWLWTGGRAAPRSCRPDAGVALRPRGGLGAARIRAALHALFGPPVEAFPRTGRRTDGRPRWRERLDRQPAEFHLSAEAGRVLLEHAPDRVVRFDFLRSLTRAQLDLFVETSLLANGTGRTAARTFVQQGRGRAEAFQFAALLAGHAASLHRLGPDDTWLVRLRTAQDFAPRAAAARRGAFTIAEERYAGHVWCVRTPNATWLARRAGTVYFTGNSFGACPHGYVFEGRGLYKSQAAQPGGNSTYYSVTLMSGPSDEITDAQINAVRQLREWLMEPSTSISGTVRGHRDFISTSCPGDKLYRMVRDGVFNQPARWGTTGEEDDEMPKFREFTGSGVPDQVIPRGEFTNVRFGDGKYSLAFESERAVVEAGVTLRMQGVPAGREVQARLALYKQVNGTWVRDRSLGVDAPVHDGGSMHLVRTGVVDVPDGRRVRLEITHYVDGPDVEVAVTGRWARVLYW